MVDPAACGATWDDAHVRRGWSCIGMKCGFHCWHPGGAFVCVYFKYLYTIYVYIRFYQHVCLPKYIHEFWTRILLSLPGLLPLPWVSCVPSHASKPLVFCELQIEVRR